MHMKNKTSKKMFKLAASFTAITCVLYPNISKADDDLYMMNDVAREYWTHGRVGEGLCGSRMRPDPEEMKEAAIDGNHMAAFRLGQLYEEGMWNVEQNTEEAIKWYELAAEGEIVHAMASLGTIYEFGRGVEIDLEKAIFWFKRAIKVRPQENLEAKIKRYQSELDIK